MMKALKVYLINRAKVVKTKEEPGILQKLARKWTSATIACSYGS
jgi:hypothetical protein